VGVIHRALPDKRDFILKKYYLVKAAIHRQKQGKDFNGMETAQAEKDI
jgi:hypothetical protein